MSGRCCSDGGSAKLGAVRTIVLLIVGVALFILMAGTIVDKRTGHVCEDNQGKDPTQMQELLRGNLQHPGNQTPGDAPLFPWNYNWDAKAGSGGSSAATNSPDRNLILVRHGQYVTETGKLTALGRQQADLTGRRLKEMNLAYTSIIHSSLERASQTSQIIHSHMTHVPLGMDDMLREGGPIPPNPTVSYWSLPAKDYDLDGPRLEAAFRKYVYRPRANQRKETFEILVGHGNIFRFFVLRALQLPKDAWMRVFIGHASITMLHIRADGTVTMTKFGDTGHMPSSKVTY